MVYLLSPAEKDETSEGVRVNDVRTKRNLTSREQYYSELSMRSCTQ